MSTKLTEDLKVFLAQVEPKALFSLMLQEDVQFNALILGLLPQETRLDLIKLLEKEKQKKVILALANLKLPPTFVLETIFQTLKTRLKCRI